MILSDLGRWTLDVGLFIFYLVLVWEQERHYLVVSDVVDVRP